MRITSDNRPQRASFSDPDGAVVSAIALTLSELPTSNHRWELRIEAKGGGAAASRELGRVVTRSPADGAPPSRVVVFAGCPGATDWTVEVRHIADGFRGAVPPRAEAELEITACEHLIPEGLIVLNGHEATESRRYYLAGAVLAPGATVVAIPAAVSVHAISAWLDAADPLATIAYTDPDTGAAVSVPIPSGRAAALGPRGTLWGPLSVTITTAVAGGYHIEGLR